MTDVYSKIFDNAIDSIELGIADYQLIPTDGRRAISAVRNIFAGILLLFKSKLAELSKDDDESLLKQKILPRLENGNMKWVGKGEKTVDVQQIKERFQSLEISVDWKCLKDLQNYRNNIEHYYDKQGCTISVVGGYIASSFIVIKNFMEKVLNLDPQASFSDNIWEIFLKEESIHDAELEEKIADFQKLEWFSKETERFFLEHRCSVCGSDLIKVHALQEGSNKAQDAEFECRNCVDRFTYESLAKEVADDLSTLNALELKDGGQELIGHCPECGEETYCTDGEICLHCGAEGSFYCSRCECEIPTEELITYEETRMCGWCAHMAERMMEED